MILFDLMACLRFINDCSVDNSVLEDLVPAKFQMMT